MKIWLCVECAHKCILISSIFPIHCVSDEPRYADWKRMKEVEKNFNNNFIPICKRKSEGNQNEI